MLLSDRMWRSMVGYEVVSSRILWVKVKIGNSRVVFVVVYAPSGKNVKEIDAFWVGLDRVISGLGRGEAVIVLGDLNAKVGKVVVERVTERHGVGERDENGDRLVDLCSENGLVVGNTLFEHRDIHKYTWRGDGERGGRSMLDYVLVDKRLRAGIGDVRVRTKVGAGVSDHMVVEGLSLIHI